MIELFEQNIRTNDRQSSKGNQLKWENEGIWYKADYTGYEGLAEYMISNLLKKSTLDKKEFVCYDLEKIKYGTVIYNGVKAMYRIPDHKERLYFLVQQVERMTGLRNFGIYMNKLLTVDAFFLNEDRHTHNIAVLMNGKGDYAYCPIFDNGAGLLADTTMDYPLSGDVYTLMDSVQSKTISSEFDEQLDISESLYKINIRFQFTKNDVTELLEKAVEYPEEIRNRVEMIIFAQMRKYNYLFSAV